MNPENVKQNGLLGDPVPRVDGRLKVTGTATYAAEQQAENLAYAVVVQSTIARGRVTEIDTSKACSAPGVLEVITWHNAPRMQVFESNPENRPGQTYLVLQDDQVRYHRQYLAIVIAETLEQAQHGAELLQIHYAGLHADTKLFAALDSLVKPERITLIDAPPVDSRRGDPDAAFATAPIRLDLTYTTPIENQNAMEPHATVASWDRHQLLLQDSTQWVFGVRNMVSTHLGIPADNVRVVSPFIGGGFGSKGNPWPHPTLAAIAARRVNRPVKLVLAREQMFSQVGHRPATFQRLRLGADESGCLISLSHHVISGTSRFDNYVESSGASSRVSYSCPNVETTHRVAKLDVNTPCPMRAPGEATGTFALETGMDELAYAANVDPLELRLRNYAERDEDRDKPFSSKSLRACYSEAAERFGWSRRLPEPRSTRRGDALVGLGMASAIFMVKLSAASARVRLNPDGSAVVSSATHDIGTGTYTSLAQVAARELQMPVSRVCLELADTALPKAPASAGSQTSGSVGSAIVLAAREVVHRLTLLASTSPRSALYGQPPSQIELNGELLQSSGDPSLRISWPKLLAQETPKQQTLEAECSWTPSKPNDRDWSGWSFGAHFCEVEVDEGLGHVRVCRWVGAFAAGRILNQRTARNQLVGAINWGISEALLEETVYDNSGRIVNASLGDYLVPVHADIPNIDVLLIGEEDSSVNPLGAKGLGELGICGAAAAVANAVYHATGLRIRNLPIRVDRFVQGAV